LRQRFQQCGIGQIHAGFIVRKQIAPNTTTCGFVCIQSDKLHHWITVCVNFAFGQTGTQRGRAALPSRRVVKRGLLCGVVVRDCQRHQLVKRDNISAIVHH